jgi:PiT family inorganic phosphate transporter
VLWAAFFNFVAFFIFHLKVAATVGKGHRRPAAIDHYVIFGALIGAIAWNLITWWYGIPSSSSHALIGGMIGATIAKAGTAPLLAPGIIKTATFIIVSPLLGMTLGALLMIAVSWICLVRAPQKVDRWFRRLQLVSSALYSIGHGSNDAQKTMGIIWLLLITAGVTTGDHLPAWGLSAATSRFALGTMFGGWRIVKTMGQKITKLRPVGGFAPRPAERCHLFLAIRIGIPVSTTHTITAARSSALARATRASCALGHCGNIVIA